MGWTGKLIGGTIGLVLGGPLGAIAGAAFGHAVDKSGDADRISGGTGAFPGYARGGVLSDPDRSRMVFFVGTFSMIAKVAQADGRVSEAEVASIEEVMSRDLRLDPASRRTAEQIFMAALQSPTPFSDFAEQFYGHFSNRPELLELLIDILLRIGTADGTLSDSEERLVKEAAAIFRFSDDRYTVIRRRYAKQDDKYFAVLGCTAESSNEEIKRAYRKLVAEYHPDKIASKGLPEEFNRFAADKFREIREAYEAVRKARGF